MRFIILLLVMTISGCSFQKVSFDMMNNSFLDYEPIENKISGIYSAPIGQYLLTYVIKENGEGVSCYPHQGGIIFERVTIYSENNNTYGLIVENGLKSTLHRLDDNSISMKYYGQKYKLRPDDNLKLANLLCKEKLENYLSTNN